MEPRPRPLLKNTFYRERWLALRTLGFKNYQQYLKSRLWKRIRRTVFSLKGRSCVICGRRATEIHHARYHLCDLAGEVLTYLHPICHNCHTFIEVAPDGVKRPIPLLRTSLPPRLRSREPVQRVSNSNKSNNRSNKGSNTKAYRRSYKRMNGSYNSRKGSYK